MRFKRRLLILLTAGALLAAACGGGNGTATPGAERKTVPAPIDKLELITRESQPPQYAVRILSGLPSGCAQFDAARITGRSDTTITIWVTNTVPADPKVACTAIYGTHEEVVELGSDFAHGVEQEYVVRVNDKELRFTAQ
jgi:ABC-type glycerol-3-phosphate transport system substrate-binding protein